MSLAFAASFNRPIIVQELGSYLLFLYRNIRRSEERPLPSATSPSRPTPCVLRAASPKRPLSWLPRLKSCHRASSSSSFLHISPSSSERCCSWSAHGRPGCLRQLFCPFQPWCGAKWSLCPRVRVPLRGFPQNPVPPTVPGMEDWKAQSRSSDVPRGGSKVMEGQLDTVSAMPASGAAGKIRLAGREGARSGRAPAEPAPSRAPALVALF